MPAWPRRFLGVLLFVGLASSCSSGPEPIAFRGVPPTAILVLPLRSVTLPAPLQDALDADVHLAVAGRGYQAVPPSVARNMLAELGQAPLDPIEDSPALLGKLADRFENDAVLVRYAEFDPRSAFEQVFVVDWQVYSTLTGARIWSHAESGGPGRLIGRYLTGPRLTYEDDPLLSDENVVTREMGGAVTEVRAKTIEQQAQDVLTRLAARLPRID